MPKKRIKKSILDPPTLRCDFDSCCNPLIQIPSAQCCKTFQKICEDGLSPSSCPFYCWSKEEKERRMNGKWMSIRRKNGLYIYL